MSESPADPRASQQRMLRALEQAAARIEELERGLTEPIAVIGLGCRFPPACRDAAGFWRWLREGGDAISRVPADRWDADAYHDPRPEAAGKICTRFGGFLEEVDRFDAEFFGISPREAAAMDPQQRLLVEAAHEALDGAGHLGDRLQANATGVFVGLTNGDYGHLLKAASGGRPLDQYFVTGNSPNAAAGRISYLLGLRGPSLVVDAACSGSLVAVHLACQSLRAGECSLALAGGANLILSPEPSIALSRARMLSGDGRCKTFDAAADGYGRGEGCGLVVLRRLADARRDGDRVLAVIRSSAVNQDGPSGGFTVPSGAAQRALLQAALDQARLSPADIDYVEAHGTGTSLGDPIEINALAEVLGPGRASTRPLLVGSVKTNLGHLESAAGVAGLIKTVLALWHGEIPPHLHFRRPNPAIAWEDLPVRVAAESLAWPEGAGPRRAGVSAFGVSGTNAHVILEQAPAEVAARALPEPRRRFRGERHWYGPRSGAPVADWYYELAWRPRSRPAPAAAPPVLADSAAHASAVRRWIAAVPPGRSAYAGILESLEALARLYARDALECVAAGDVAPAHHRLFGRLKALAAKAGAGDAAAEAQRLLAACPEAEIEIALLQRCGERLPEVLRGDCDPLNLLFPADGTPTAAGIYRDSPAARRLNELTAATVGALFAEKSSGRPLRVLEIGAGTGATTDAVLGALPAGSEYVFTDVSPLFVAEASRRLGGRPGLRFQTLDVERDPLTQGMAAGRFDLVIAANVLHATRDLRSSLRHVRSLLAPGGRLVLLEANRPLGFLDLIFGLTEGWWRFADADLRPDYPLLTAERWAGALRSAGFSDPEAMGFAEEAGAIFAAQSVIAARREREPADTWLILADRGGVASALEEALTRSGEICRTAHGAEALGGQPSWRGVVDLRALDAGDAPGPEPSRGALLLAQALIARPSPLWIATRGALAVGAADAVPGLGASPLWGFARSLAREHPELRPIRVDLDPRAATAAAAEALASELLNPDGEDELAWRGGERRAARLVRSAPQSAGTVALRADGTYLVTGGRGGLGRALARWLVERGARHLVLLGRSEPDAAARALAGELAAAGAEVRLEQGDAASEADLSRIIEAVAASPWPLRGVIHAAGVLDDGVLSQLTWERFERVLAPKVAGAWRLHRLTENLPLDCFVLFSSATGLLGSPGQANHAAANTFLDALAHHRRAAGRPAVSIDWGAWADIGAAADRGVAGRFRAGGIGTIPPAEGWRALERIWASGSAQTAVLPVDWSAIPAAMAKAPLFTELAAAHPPSTAAAPALDPGWTALPREERRARLKDEIRRQVAAILGLPGPERVDPERGFFTLGMDSLTSVELRNRLQASLGRTLPAAAVFDHPTAARLAEFLAGPEGGRPSAEPRRARASIAHSRPAERGRAGAEPIAVVGLGLRFPGGADSPESFRDLLLRGVDAVAEVPPERWSLEEFYDPDPAAPGKICTRQGGFLRGVDLFDAGFFGVSPREAAAMDPQQRLLLEVVWEALEHAGVAPDSLGGSRTGVFVGISNHDYTERLLAAGPGEIDSFVGSGNAHSVAAGRISYALGLQGPSLAVDTACSSSLVAAHLACQSLRAGECDLALAGGVNLLLSPTISINHSRARMLAADGRCKSFDAAADGFGRSDGCGVVALKRLSDARRDGDRVLALLLGSAVNQDGRTSGLTVPNGPSQQAVIRSALTQAGAEPHEVGLIEAHGTGTSLGDPIELGALAAVFGPGRGADRPLHVGSVKTNLGHAESAAGVAGLIKAVLAVAHGEIPAHLHFRTPNPLVPWAEMPWMRVPMAATPWPAGDARLAGVSSFGFGGTNAHVVVGPAPAELVAGPPPRGDEVLVLSAKSESALRSLAGRYGELLERRPEMDWGEVCHTAAIGRARLPHRLAVAAGNGVRATLRAFAGGGSPAGAWTGLAGEWPRVAFLFPGQGSLHPGMGRELHAASDIYRDAFDACAAIVEQQAGWSLHEAIDSADRLGQTEFGQVALFAVEFSLCSLWQTWGLLPDAVLGHSVGEFAAACAAGRLALEQALPLLIIRARLMGNLGEGGAMAAVAGTEADVAAAIARHGVELAAVNSPRQVVLTGDGGAIAAAAVELRAAGRRVQLLEVRQGYHSRQMEPMLSEFTRLAGEILADYREPERGPNPEVAFISSMTGGPEAAELGGAGYWARQIRQPVRFAAALSALRAQEIGLLVEVGPRATLATLGQQTWPAGNGEWLTSLVPGRDEGSQVRESAARAWVLGAPIDWIEVHRERRRPRVALPTYPFERRRHWCAERAAASPIGYEFFWQAAQLGAARTAAAGAAWHLAGGSPELRRELARELARRGRTLSERIDARTEGVALLADDLGGGSPVASAGEACERLRALVRARIGSDSPARIWIVTRGAAAGAPGTGESLALAAAPLWGFGKAFALEHAECFGGMLDLPPAPETGEAALAVDAWLAASGEDQLALRGGAFQAPRLRPRPLPPARISLRADGAYLVTGGLGALGLRVAGWLAGHGARRIVLVGRRPASAAAEAEIARWRASGVAVSVHALDAAEPETMRELVAGLPGLRGVVHAAGIAGFADAAALAAVELAAVLRPKVAGAWALHQASRGAELDFFVLFSSISSAWGSKGQAHYAAANAFLDALAHHRRALGLPALSINWGPWSGGGMATGEALELLQRSGVGALAPEEALAALGSALAEGPAQLVAARVNWDRFIPVLETRGPRTLFSGLGRAVSAPAGGETPSRPRAELAGLAGPELLSRLQTLVQAAVARALRLPEGEQPSARLGFSEMGVDSLLAVEIRNRLAGELGLALPATLLFDHPDIVRLARFLATLHEPSVPPAEPAAEGPDDEAARRIARMSDAEAEAALLKKLEEL